MAREATQNLTQAAAIRFGTEPVNIIRIDWDDVTVYYGDKSMTIGSIVVQGGILDFSTLSSQVKSLGAADFSSVSVTLDDSDGDLKQRINTQLLEGRDATAYQYFEGLDSDDLMILIKGRISGDVIWSEGERTLSFDIEHYIDDNEVGYAPEEGEIPNMSEDAIDQPWPLCFGCVLKVPAVHLLNPPFGELQDTWLSDFFGVRSTFEVDNGEEFPQDVVIDILVGGLVVRGTMDNNTFTVQEANLPRHTNISVLERRRDDPHWLDSRVCWIEDDGTRLVGKYCYLKLPFPAPFNQSENYNEYQVNYCIAQYGGKCYFQQPWHYTNGSETRNITIDETYTILETASIPRIEWENTYWWLTVNANWEPGGPNNYSIPTLQPFTLGQQFGVIRGYWRCKPGTNVRLLAGYNDLYIANLLPSTEVLEVYAWRSYRGEDIFAPIPSRYFNIYKNYSIAGREVTAIEFPNPLSAYSGENWQEDIYVSLRSTRGPNTSDIIKWLIETYSNLEIEPDSFEYVRQAVTKFWANFAVFDQPNVLSLCEDIARQSRCAILIGNGQIKIKYLSEIPVPIQTLNRDLTELKSLQLAFSTLDSVITRSKNSWRLDYSEREEKEKEYVYKNNINTLGLQEEEDEYFIYNVELFVKISAGFWGYRTSNIWRKLVLSTFLQAIKAEAFDAFTLSIEDFSENDILAEVDTQSHDTNFAPNIELQLTAGSKSGESEDGQPIQDDNYWLGDPNYPVDMEIPSGLEPCTGRGLVDYIVPTEIDGGGEADDDDDDGNPYILVFVIVPSAVIRGEAFGVRIEIQDKDGNTINTNRSGQLVLTSTDNNDVLGSGGPGSDVQITINFVSGVYVNNNLYITDGADVDSGNLTVSASTFDSKKSLEFTINDLPVDSLLWETCPNAVPVLRGIDFTVKISGAAPNQTLNIEMATVDDLDSIYIDGVKKGQAFTVKCDAFGVYESTEWQIRGGYTTPSAAYLVATDPDELLLPDDCTIKSILGDSPAVLEQTFEFTDELKADSPYLVLEVIGPAGAGIRFQLKATLYETDGTIKTDFTGTLLLIATDANSVQLDWLDAGPAANNYTQFVNANMINGEWIYDATLLDVKEDTVEPITIEGTVLLPPDDTPIQSTIDIGISSIYFVVTVNPVEVTRGVVFTIGVQAMNADDTPYTAYVPVGNLNVLIDSSDPGDAIIPTTIDNTGWVDGYKLATGFLIIGGINTDTATITIIDPATGLEGYADLYIDATPVAKNLAEMQSYFGADSRMAAYIGPDYETDWNPMDCESLADSWWLLTQQGALNDFRAENTLNNVNYFYRQIIDYYHYANHVGRFSFGHTRFNVTALDRADAKGLVLKARVVHVRYYDPCDKKTILSPISGAYKLRLGVTYNLDYLNGSQVEFMFNPIEYSFAFINQKNLEAGWMPGAFQTPNPQIIEIPLPLEWVEDMTTDNFYLWWFVEGPTTSYICSQFSINCPCGPPCFYGGDSNLGGEQHYVDDSDMQLRILK